MTSKLPLASCLLATVLFFPACVVSVSAQELPPVPGQTGLVFCVAFSRDGKLMAFGGEDKSVKIVDLATRQIRQSFVHSERIWSIAFGPDSGM